MTSVCCDAFRFRCGRYCGWGHRGRGAIGCDCTSDSAGGVFVLEVSINSYSVASRDHNA